MRRDSVKNPEAERLAAPPLPILETDQAEIHKLYQALTRSRAKLVGPDGKSQALPDSLYGFLKQLIVDLVEGKSVSIIQKDAQLTTVEAANILGVSRQFLVKLLKDGKIPHHEVGTHRRIYMRDLLGYKAERDHRRTEVLNDLVRAEVEAGQYEVFSADDHAE